MRKAKVDPFEWDFALPAPSVAEIEASIKKFACEEHGEGDPGHWQARGFSCWTCDIRHGKFRMLAALQGPQLTLGL